MSEMPFFGADFSLFLRVSILMVVIFIFMIAFIFFLVMWNNYGLCKR